MGKESEVIPLVSDRIAMFIAQELSYLKEKTGLTPSRIDVNMVEKTTIKGEKSFVLAGVELAFSHTSDGKSYSYHIAGDDWDT